MLSVLIANPNYADYLNYPSLKSVKYNNKKVNKNNFLVSSFPKKKNLKESFGKGKL